MCQCEESDEITAIGIGGHGSFVSEANLNFATDSDKHTWNCHTLMLRDSRILQDLHNHHSTFLHNGFELDPSF